MSSLSENLALSLTRIAIFVLLALRLVQVWINPVDDFDTSSFILGVQGGFYPGFEWFFDFAHPGLLSVWLWLGHQIDAAFAIPPIHLWAVFIGAGLLTACTVLYGLLRREGCTKLVAAFGVLLYLASPAIADIAGRSEENVLFHSLLLLAILSVMRALRSADRCTLVLVAASSVVLAAQHLQPFLILTAGIALYCVVGRFDESETACSGRGRAFRVLLAVVVPGLIFYLAVHIAYVKPALVSSYSENVYSLFHNDSIARYLRAFLMFAQGFVASGDLSVTQWTPRSVEPASMGYLSGIVVVVVAFWISLRRGLVDLMVLSALGFVFLYEPSASERWDTFVITAVLALMFRLRDSSVSANGHARIAAFVCCLLMAANLVAMRGQIEGLNRSTEAQRAIGMQMGETGVLHTDLDSGRNIVSRVPRDTRFVLPKADNWTTGDALYLNVGIGAIEDRFRIRCAPTDISGLCRVLP